MLLRKALPGLGTLSRPQAPRPRWGGALVWCVSRKAAGDPRSTGGLSICVADGLYPATPTTRQTRPNMKILDVPRIFLAFGGPRGLLNAIEDQDQYKDLNYNVVQMWRSRNVIPSKWLGAVLWAYTTMVNANIQSILIEDNPDHRRRRSRSGAAPCDASALTPARPVPSPCWTPTSRPWWSATCPR